MPFASANAETVIFRYPPLRDAFQRLGSAVAVDVVVQDCLFAPGQGTENLAQANQVIADAVLYTPADAPAITAQDQVVVRGEVYEVVEKPRLWTNEGYEIALRLVTG